MFEFKKEWFSQSVLKSGSWKPGFGKCFATLRKRKQSDLLEVGLSGENKKGHAMGNKFYQIPLVIIGTLLLSGQIGASQPNETVRKHSQLNLPSLKDLKWQLENARKSLKGSEGTNEAIDFEIPWEIEQALIEFEKSGDPRVLFEKQAQFDSFFERLGQSLEPQVQEELRRVILALEQQSRDSRQEQSSRPIRAYTEPMRGGQDGGKAKPSGFQPQFNSNSKPVYVTKPTNPIKSITSIEKIGEFKRNYWENSEGESLSNVRQNGKGMLSEFKNFIVTVAGLNESKKEKSPQEEFTLPDLFGAFQAEDKGRTKNAGFGLVGQNVFLGVLCGAGIGMFGVLIAYGLARRSRKRRRSHG